MAAPIVDTANVQGVTRDKSTALLSLDAYTLCLEARQHLERGGKGDLRAYFELASEAAATPPESAETRALNAEALVKRHIYWSDGVMLLDMALAEAEAAIHLDPALERLEFLGMRGWRHHS